MATRSKARSADTTETTRKQQEVQAQQDKKDAKKSGQKKVAGSARQTGSRRHPQPPLPEQHLKKPGLERNMVPRPQYMAPTYRGSGKLEGFAAIVTGGDSGIGRAVSILFAREGADVAVVYLDEHADAEETGRAVEAEGRTCLLIPGDVKDPEFCRKAVQEAIDAFGKLDVLVNNAGFQEHAGALEDITDERFDETMRTNVYGYFYMARAAVPYMSAGSSIINTGSVTGLRGHGTLLDYSSTKGAIHAFTMSLASNLIKKGIRVNAVAPGPIWTPLNPADQPAKKIKSFGEGTSMQRPGQPEELSPAYVYLASPVCSSFVTGIVLPVTGSPG
ncbi:SDR family oxidoreductase [Allopusillimonas soli]|uniref:SDR family oxidoreductase n=1 Tax=Allopusillimonas soli TaxID=659016 RepID=A0A853FEX1_9BURK|nr:SDR family oxidoreductase [Allopusillimonas soli]NYT37370.1 SDR family oxidoreductase [Allopusillimonas soli]TEA74648.1 SDR family oxidoreductase [Allopusillimonas soli]